MYKFINNNLAPAYRCNYDFSNAKKKLMLPKPRIDYLKRSFSDSGAILWNNLPEEIRISNALAFFKRSSHRWFSDHAVLPHGKYVKQFLRIFNQFSVLHCCF